MEGETKHCQIKEENTCVYIFIRELLASVEVVPFPCPLCFVILTIVFICMCLDLLAYWTYCLIIPYMVI